MIKCKIDGCGREIMYKADQVCQKHYFRMMRNGTYETIKKEPKQRRENPAGYQLIYNPSHPLAQAQGYVYEHRLVAYEKYGENLPPCELCGKETSWKAYTTHIDHIDEDVRNNNPENLRPLCNGCNSRRGANPAHERVNAMAVEYQGVIKTPSGWAKDNRVLVAGATIRNRLRRGWAVEDALFSPPITRPVKQKAA